MLTKRAQQTLTFIQQFIANNNHAPTIAEIAKGIGISSRGVVHRYLKALEQAQLLSLLPGHKRNIQLNTSLEHSDGLPILGQIAAGKPILAVENNNRFEFSELYKSDRFLLQVKGNSMIGDNICDGDYIICETRTTVQPHEIAVVLINEEEATLKRIRTGPDGQISLIPSNPEMEPQHFPAEQIRIQGVYCGLIRMNLI